MVGIVLGSIAGGCVLDDDAEGDPDEAADGGAGTSDPGGGGVGSGARCVELEGRRYITAERQTICAPTPCNWTLEVEPDSRRRSKYRHHNSVVVIGFASCAGGNLFQGDRYANGALIGTYDALGESLEWDGLLYVLDQP